MTPVPSLVRARATGMTEAHIIRINSSWRRSWRSGEVQHGLALVADDHGNHQHNGEPAGLGDGVQQDGEEEVCGEHCGQNHVGHNEAEADQIELMAEVEPADALAFEGLHVDVVELAGNRTLKINFMASTLRKIMRVATMKPMMK